MIICQSVTCNNTSKHTYSLANYLPKDGYNYEIFLDLHAVSGNVIGNYTSIIVETSVYNKFFAGLAHAITNYNVRTVNSVHVEIGKDRQISFDMSNTIGVGEYTAYSRGYRRIGV